MWWACKRLAEVLAEELVAQAEPDAPPAVNTEEPTAPETEPKPEQEPGLFEPRVSPGAEDGARREEMVRQCVIRLQELSGTAAWHAAGCRRAEIGPGRTARRPGSRRVDLR